VLPRFLSKSKGRGHIDSIELKVLRLLKGASGIELSYIDE